MNTAAILTAVGLATILIIAIRLLIGAAVSIEAMGKDLWLASVWITESIRKAMVWAFVHLFRGNRWIHGFIRKYVGEGLTALLFTALILQFCALIYISCTMKITLERVITAIAVDAKVAAVTKSRGLW